MTKYATVFGIAAREQIVYIPAFIGRNLFFVLIMFVFYSLWKAVYGGEQVIAGFTMTQTLWYLTFTEVISLSQTGAFGPISTEIKDGTVAYSLNRPYSYTGYWLSRAMGENLVRAFPLLVEGFLLALLFAGPLPGYLRAFPLGMLTVVGGILVTCMLQVIVGLLAFWFEEVSPFWWIISKLVFVIGGMFIPIDFYPEWLQQISKATPFAFAAYWPATTFVAFSPQRAATTLLGQLGYIIAFGLVIAGLYRLAVRKLHAHGG